MYRFYTLFLFLLTFSVGYSNAQSWSSQASQGGFILNKVVSDTTIATGQTFSYTVYFTIPAGATNVTINDVLPPNLVYMSSSVNNACGTPTVNAPPVNSQGGTLSVFWASVPGGCTSSLTITVAFPNGVTCPGTMARNQACIQGTLAGKVYEFCTGFVITTATAVNPWHINKYPIGLAWMGGNCPWATSNDTVTYQICVYKDVGTTGQLNLVSGVVTDTLPTGAQLISSTCGATQSGNVITWNVGNMSALPAYNSACCQFKIYYPIAQFPSGSNISNAVYLSGGLGPTQQPCSNFSANASTCIQKIVITSGTLSKWVYTNRQPGCAGQYLIYICNTGTTPLPVVALDTLPTQLSGYSVATVWPNTFTAVINSGILNINGNLSPGQCAYVYVNFTIPLSATINSTITNCVHLVSIVPNLTSCNSFVIDAPAATPCVWKEVCNKQTSYTPGSIFRYRLRIQNIGGLALSGVQLTDVLNPNLQYIGNPSYYTLNTWNVPNCNPNPNPSDVWAGVNLSYNSGTNTVTATLPSIPAVCQNIFYNACGMYGTPGVPYYYIEFDVKVRDTSALGNIPNNFSLSGGVLGSATVTSNIENVLVVGVVGYTLNKDVKKPNDTTFVSGLTTIPGANIVYRLKLNSSGTAALTHLSFVDLLPLDNSPNDQKILQLCGSRGSQFNVTFNSSTGTPIPTTPSGYTNSILSLANVNNFVPAGIPGNAFTIGCGSTGGWTSGVTTGDKNLGEYFGSVALGVAGAEYQFIATVDPNALPKQISCNTFAASAWTKHLIQSSIINYQRAGELESNPACLTIDSNAHKPCFENAKLDIKCIGEDPATGIKKYSVTLSGSSCAPAVLSLSSIYGSFVPSSFNLATSPWSINSTYTNTSGANPITIIFNLNCNGSVCIDSVMRDLPPCEGVPPLGCCDNFIKIIKDPKISYNSATGAVAISVPMFAGPNTIKKFTATIVSAQLRRICGTFASPWQRIFGDITNANLVIPPNPGPQFLSIFSREAVWGEADTCVAWQNGANLSLKMIFPPFTGSKLCKDTLRFGIRYSFTDCKCLTCDTVIFYTIVRKPMFIPWNPTGNGSIGLPPVIEKGGNGSVSEIQAETPTSTSLIMQNTSDGTLWIISPSGPDNNVTIKSLEFNSPEITFNSIKYLNVQGNIQGNFGNIDVEVKPGDTKQILLSFNNVNSLKKFTVFVTFKYVLDDSQDIINSDPIPYLALVPGGGTDLVGVDKGTKPLGVRTYAIYLHNNNNYSENTAAISITPTTNHKILAAGPPQEGTNGTLLYPRVLDDGTFVISIPAQGNVIAPSTVVKPIFLTFSGAADSDPEFDFSTYNESGTLITQGNAKLSDPISKVKEEQGGGIIDMSVFPNPSSNLISVSLTVPYIISDANISVYDLFGRKLGVILNNSVMDSGTHIFNFDISNLISGTYYVELRSSKVTESKSFIIKK